MKCFFAASLPAVAACGSADDDNVATNPKRGWVGITNAPGTSAYYLASASFRDSTAVAPSVSTCQQTTEGSCIIFTCSGDARTTGTPKDVKAGPVRINGAALGSAITLVPEANDKYSEARGTRSIWSGGEAIAIEVGGDPEGAPAFARSLKAPSLVTVTSPTWPAGSAGPTIDTSKNLEIAWTHGPVASGEVEVSFVGHNNIQGTTVQCHYPVADKKGEVPASVLQRYPKGSVAFGVGTHERTSFVVSDWDMNLLLSAPGVREGGGYIEDAVLE